MPNVVQNLWLYVPLYRHILHDHESFLVVTQRNGNLCFLYDLGGFLYVGEGAVIRKFYLNLPCHIRVLLVYFCNTKISEFLSQLKNRNEHLRKTIIECAWAASRTKECIFSQFSYHQTQVRKKNKMKVYKKPSPDLPTM